MVTFTHLCRNNKSKALTTVDYFDIKCFWRVFSIHVQSEYIPNTQACYSVSVEYIRLVILCHRESIIWKPEFLWLIFIFTDYFTNVSENIFCILDPLSRKIRLATQSFIVSCFLGKLLNVSRCEQAFIAPGLGSVAYFKHLNLDQKWRMQPFADARNGMDSLK